MKRNWRSHYITLLANLIVVIATAINFPVASLALNGTTGNITMYVIIIAPFLAALISSFLYYLDIKYFFADYPYKKFHFRKKWTKFYILGICVFALEIIVILVFAIVGSFNYLNVLNAPTVDSTKLDQATNLLNALLWSSFGIGCVLGLVTMGFVKYSRFKIDVEILARKNGKSVSDDKSKNNKLIVDEKSVIIDFEDSDNKKSSKDKLEEKDSNKDEPSAGLSSI